MTNEGFATAYIAFALADENSADYRRHFWVFETFSRLCVEDPQEAWKQIQAILSLSSNAKVVGRLAAGPMEDLLNQHGREIIDQVEQQASSDPKVAQLLGGVWKSRIDEAVWIRVEAARSHRW